MRRKISGLRKEMTHGLVELAVLAVAAGAAAVVGSRRTGLRAVAAGASPPGMRVDLIRVQRRSLGRRRSRLRRLQRKRGQRFGRKGLKMKY